jgi:hypothetical protein
MVSIGRGSTVCGVHKQGSGAVPALHLQSMSQCAVGMAHSILQVS